MFDEVSGRYDLLNRIMSLGRDRAWRAAMWDAVPEDAHAVLDLCTGSGTSLPGLRRPGRLVIGADVSLGMLEHAQEQQWSAGWAPRLVCADAFRLPLPDHGVDAVTIAFGIRNLRPRSDALAELARVLRPGGTLAVLEATAPARGPFAWAHGFYLRHIIPLAGRLSPDPSAYKYLSASVFEFGAGPEFEQALAAAGFEVIDRLRFMLGATRLWVARSRAATGQNLAAPASGSMRNARAVGQARVNVRSAEGGGDSEWRIWTTIQLLLAVAITAALIWGWVVMAKFGDDLPLTAWQRPFAWVLLYGGLVLFGLRSVALLLRLLGPARRR
jgi:demethylmenaquinone methyltransferase/2-methoxy-6-polyprenyl-1,4-benzoquinol methylase